MVGIVSALALGLLLVLAPTAVIAVLIYVCSSGIKRDGRVQSGLSSTSYAVTLAVISCAIVALVSAGIDSWAASQADEDMAVVTIPILLVVCLLASAKVPAHPVRGPLMGALGATAGAALYYPIMTAVQGAGDHTALWGIGMLFVWIACGIPLFITAIVIATVRARA